MQFSSRVCEMNAPAVATWRSVFQRRRDDDIDESRDECPRALAHTCTVAVAKHASLHTIPVSDDVYDATTSKLQTRERPPAVNESDIVAVAKPKKRMSPVAVMSTLLSTRRRIGVTLKQHKSATSSRFWMRDFIREHYDVSSGKDMEKLRSFLYRCMAAAEDASNPAKNRDMYMYRGKRPGGFASACTPLAKRRRMSGAGRCRKAPELWHELYQFFIDMATLVPCLITHLMCIKHCI